MALELLLFELLVAPGLESGEALIEAARAPRSSQTVAWVKSASSRLSWLISASAERLLGEVRLQPLDRHEIEMIGRLVEQQDVRLRARTRARAARRASPPESGGIGLGMHPEILHQRAGRIAIVDSPSPARTKSSVVAKPVKSGSCGR